MSSSEAQLTSDTYYPTLDQDGNYIDKIPFNFNSGVGFDCPCWSRKEKIFFTRKGTLSCHFKTKRHELWIASLNLNKHNHFVENEELKKIVESQKLQISEQSKVISKQNFKINAQLNAIKSLNVMLNIYHNDTQMQTQNCIEVERESTINLIDFDVI